mgnify:CR=1 FL=1
MTPKKIVIESLKWMFTDPIRFFKNYNRNVYYKKQIIKNNFPTQLPTVDLLDLFDGKFNVELNKYTYLENTSTVIDLAILKALAQNIKECNYFEIGTFRGESAMNVASSAATVTSLNLSDEELRDLNLSNNKLGNLGVEGLC